MGLLKLGSGMESRRERRSGRVSGAVEGLIREWLGLNVLVRSLGRWVIELVVIPVGHWRCGLSPLTRVSTDGRGVDSVKTCRGKILMLSI